MDEDRWENIILGEITVLSRLNHPHAAPSPFVAPFPITKLAADLTGTCTDPIPASPAQLSPLIRWGGRGSMGRPLPSPCLSPSSSVESNETPNPHGFHELAFVAGRDSESTATLSIKALQQLPLKPKDHQPFSFHPGTPHLLARFCGMRAKATVSRG